jgi:hypothetical protein
VWIDAGTVECKTLYVYDVKTGHIKVQEQAVPPVNTSISTLISSIVVKANGSVAWSGGEQTGPGQVDYQVQTDDSTGTGPVTVDHGDDIAPESLGKASDGLSIYWIRGGVARTPRCSSAPRRQCGRGFDDGGRPCDVSQPTNSSTTCGSDACTCQRWPELGMV